MARVTIYRDHSSIIPMFDTSENISIPIIKIKKEPIDDEADKQEYDDDYISDNVSTTASTSTSVSTSTSISKQSYETSSTDTSEITRRITRRSAASESASLSQDGSLKGMEYYSNARKSKVIANQLLNVQQLYEQEYNDATDTHVQKKSKDKSSNKMRCDICSATFSHKGSLSLHTRHYNGPIKCYYCKKTFEKMEDYAKHRVTTHKLTEILTSSKCQCDYCKIVFKSKNCVQQHIMHYHRDRFNCTDVEPLLEKNRSSPSNKINSENNVKNNNNDNRDNNSSLLIREFKAQKRKRTRSSSSGLITPITTEHTVNTRSNSNRHQTLHDKQGDNYETSFLNSKVTQLSDRITRDKSTKLCENNILQSHNNDNNIPNPPLVQIYAIPNEVDALLNSDCDEVPSKRMKLQVLSNNNADNHNSSRRKLNYDNLEICNSTSPTKSKILSPRMNSILKENFNNCHVQLVQIGDILNTSKSPSKMVESENCHNINVNSNENKNNNEIDIETLDVEMENSTPKICSTVGIELENLDIALKKLKKPSRDPLHMTSNESSTHISSSSSDDLSFDSISAEHSYSAVPPDEIEAVNVEVDQEEGEEEEEEEVKEKDGNADEEEEGVKEKDVQGTEMLAETKRPAKPKNVYLSSICRTRFTTQKKLVYHYLYHHNYPNYICPVCRIEFSRLGELRKHLLIHCLAIPKSSDDNSPINPKGPCPASTSKKFNCKNCKKFFTTVTFFDEHKQTCKVLEKRDKKRRSGSNETSGSSNNNTLNNSLSSNFTGNNFNNVSLQSSSSQSHSQKIHNDPLTNSRNPISPNNLSALRNFTVKVNDKTSIMQEHMPCTYTEVSRPRVIGNGQYHCNICDSQFQTMTNLGLHHKRYTAQLLSSCDKCGTTFPSIRLLASHKKSAHNIVSLIHRPDKPYCLICDQGFSEKSLLRQHTMHIHYRELKNFNESSGVELAMICRICNVTFHNRKKFIEHSMYYYEDRIIRCNICNEQFFGQFNAHRHSKEQHNTELFRSYSHVCDICDDRFAYLKHLQSHLYHIHRDQITPRPDHQQFYHYQYDMHINKKKSETQTLHHLNNVTSTTMSEKNFENYESSNTPEGYPESIIEYTCAVCDKQFTSEYDSKRHINEHKLESMNMTTDQESMLPIDSQIHTNSINDNDTKCNLLIANICSVELKEYHKTINNTDDVDKDLLALNEDFNACHGNNRQPLEHTDLYNNHNKINVDVTCNETFTPTNVAKQPTLPCVRREFPASNKCELIVKAKETTSNNITTTTTTTTATVKASTSPIHPTTTVKSSTSPIHATSSGILQMVKKNLTSPTQQSDINSQVPAIKRTEIQTSIKQYLTKIPNIKKSYLCEFCELSVEKEFDLEQHKLTKHKNEYVKPSVLRRMEWENVNLTSDSRIATTTTLSPLMSDTETVSQQSTTEKISHMTIDDDIVITNVEGNNEHSNIICTDGFSTMTCNDNFKNNKDGNRTRNYNNSNDNHLNTTVEKSILLQYLQNY